MKIGFYLVRGLLRGLSALPLGFHYAWAGFFAWVMRDLLHYRRDVVTINLARSFPEKKYSELRRISKQFYKHFGEILAEAIWYGGCLNPKRLHKQHLVETVNPEVLDEAFRGSPSVMVMDSHCGNWELLGGYFEYDYRVPQQSPCSVKDVVVVYKPLSSKLWDEMMRLNRCAPLLRDGFDGYVSNKNVLRHALSHRNEKKIYIFACDQRPYASAMTHDDVDFLHQPTKAMLGAASLACKMKMSVVYLNMKRVEKGRNEITFTPICMDASTMTPHQIMQEYFTLLEKDINALPWNYLWSHKRWK